MSLKNPVATLDDTEVTPAQRALMSLQVPDDLPPSNEELESAVQAAGLYNAAMRYIKPLDVPIQQENRRRQVLWERETAKATAVHDQNLLDGIPDEEEFQWPEEPQYERTTSYQDFVAQLGGSDRVRVMIEVARARARRDKK